MEPRVRCLVAVTLLDVVTFATRPLLQILLECWDITGTRWGIASHRIASHRIASHRIAFYCIALPCIASHCIALHRIASRCIAGDSFATLAMYERRLKPWVSQLVMPWIIIYCVACAASLFALGYKLHLLVKKLRARARSAVHDAAQPSWPISTRGTVNLGGLEIPQELSSNASVRDLWKKLEDNQQKIRTLYCLFLLVAVEGACHRLPRCTVLRQAARRHGSCSGTLQTCRCPFSRSCFCTSQWGSASTRPTLTASRPTR